MSKNILPRTSSSVRTSTKRERELVLEKYADCKIYVGLTIEEAKLLAWDHNTNNDYRQKMSSIERIRFFYHKYLDTKQKTGIKLYLAR